MKSTSDETLKASLLRQKTTTRHLVRELRALMQLTQVQLAEALGVAYETINRWENGHMQPSPLALRQIRGVIRELSLSSSRTIRNGSKALLDKYFAEEEGL
jgi:putative transcriptional regulator